MKKSIMIYLLMTIIYTGCALTKSNKVTNPRLITVSNGWAKNSVNTTIFRHNSLVTYKDTQYIVYYDAQQNVVLGKRKIGSDTWQIHITKYKGNAMDAHRSISIMIDGAGYLHVSWDHHGNVLRYCRSVKPGSLELTDKMPMTGIKEQHVTYPEFYRLPNGNLLFFYRDGGSGNGNLMLNGYDIKTQKWTQVQNGFIDGEGQRNAYWQVAIDKQGIIHLSFVWRETGDVATNHDMCYARSGDGGMTWEKSTGEKYILPITRASAEYACRIPEKSELINSTSMVADDNGRPYIVTYWKSANTMIPQYKLIYNDGRKWITIQISDRKTPFTLSGGGTKRIPISRPLIMVKGMAGKQRVFVVYRDEERGDKVSVTTCDDLLSGKWHVRDLNSISLGFWEPTYDTELWNKTGILNLFVQNVEQGDGETTKDIPPQPVTVLEWKPNFK